MHPPTSDAGFWAAIASITGGLLVLAGTIYATRSTARQTRVAAKRDAAVKRDQLNLESWEKLAEQNRLDREELRQDREVLKGRLETLEGKYTDLSGVVEQLKIERDRDRAQIEQLELEVRQHESVKDALLRYVQKLREFIVALGQTPPSPDNPIPLD